MILCVWNLLAYPKSQSLILPFFNDKNYISYHNVLNLDICMDKSLFVHVADSMKKLSEDFDYFFLLEYLELHF